MNIIKSLGQQIKATIMHSSYRGSSNYTPSNIPIDIRSFGGDGVGAYYRYDGVGSVLGAYEKCAPLMTVINRRGQALANGIVEVKNTLGNNSTSTESKAFINRLNNPNKFETRETFFAKLSAFIDLTGYALILPYFEKIEYYGIPTGISPLEADGWFIVPPTYGVLEEDANATMNPLNGGVLGVRINGKLVGQDQFMVICNDAPSINKMGIPQSPIKALEVPINNVIGALESESTLIKHRGPTTIISAAKASGDMVAPKPIDEKFKRLAQEGFNHNYGLMGNQSHFMLTDTPIDAQKVGFNADELKLNDSVKNNVKIIADKIGFPLPLLGVLDTPYDNLETAGKHLYTQFVIPQGRLIIRQIGSYCLPNGEIADFNFSDVPELQKDKFKEAQARKALIDSLKIEFDMDLITQNQMLTLIGLPEISNGDLRKSEIPPGNVPLAVTLGVGGVQALTVLLSTQGISESARQTALEVVFGLSPEDASRMSVSGQQTIND